MWILTHVLAQLIAQLADVCVFLHAAYLGVLLGLALDLDPLPWQFATQEVEQKVAQRLEIVSAALFEAFVRGHAGVPRRAY